MYIYIYIYISIYIYVYKEDIVQPIEWVSVQSIAGSFDSQTEAIKLIVSSSTIAALSTLQATKTSNNIFQW